LVNGAEGGELASMTGFASREGHANGVDWSWELRAVNGRGLDLRLRLPDGYGALDAPLRKAIAARVKRGSVTLGLRVQADTASGSGRVDPAALDAALGHLKQVLEAADARGVSLVAPTAAEVLNLKGVTETGTAANGPAPADLLADIDPLLEAFNAMRATEGAALKTVLEGQLAQIETLVSAAGDAARTRGETQAARFRANLASLSGSDSTADPDRIAQEIAILAVKSDVMEELDRLADHVTAARDLLAKGGPVGRKLDFLMQEFNREANTLCSKSADTALTAIGLDLKLTIDQMR